MYVLLINIFNQRKIRSESKSMYRTKLLRIESIGVDELFQNSDDKHKENDKRNQ